MSIPTLLICDGDDEQQTRLESLIKGDSSFRYIATVSKQDGQMAIEQGIKVGVKLVWMDLNDEPDACYTLMAQSKQVHQELPIIISKRGLDPETIRYSLNAGALECLEEATAQVQLKIVAAKLGVAAPAQATAPAAQAQAAQAQTAPAQPGSQTAGSSKWGDLDSIPTPGAVKHNQELTGEIHVGANPGVGVASSTQTQALQQTSPAGQLALDGETSIRFLLQDNQPVLHDRVCQPCRLKLRLQPRHRLPHLPLKRQIKPNQNGEIWMPYLHPRQKQNPR